MYIIFERTLAWKAQRNILNQKEAKNIVNSFMLGKFSFLETILIIFQVVTTHYSFLKENISWWNGRHNYR